MRFFRNLSEPVRRLFTKLWARIAGVGLIGALAIFTVLFGDNIVGRIIGSERTPQLDQGTIVPSTPEVAEEPDLAQSIIERHAPSRSTLFERLCKGKKISLSYKPLPGDPDRFVRRAGRTIVAIPNCFEDDQTFSTRVGDSDPIFDGKGIVAGRELEFNYTYFDNEGRVVCRVTGAAPDQILVGEVSCEGFGATMQRRPTAIEIEP